MISDEMKGNEGFYSSVDANSTGTITFFGDATTTTSFSSPTKQTVAVVRNDYETPWYSIAASGATSSMTVSSTSTDSKVTTAENTPVDIILGNTYNEIKLGPVNVDSEGVNVRESSEDKGVAVIVEGDKELDRDTMKHSVMFYPMNGEAINTLDAVSHGSTISKPADPSYNGYKFDGWYLDSEYKNTWSFDTPVTSDIQLFAKWSKNSSNPSNPSKPSNPSHSTGSSGSSSGSSFHPTYSISAPSRLTGGKVSVSPSSASAGQRITITTSPDTGYELGKLTAVDSKGKELVLTDQGNGKYTFSMPSSKVTIDAAFDPVQPLTPGWNNPFVDVAGNAWYYDAVKFVNQQNMMNGTTANTFSPNAKLTRAQLAQALYNKEGRPAVNTQSSFADAPSDAWYANAISWAVSKGIISGYGNGNVGPNDPITREQLATILWRYSNSPVSNYQLQFNDTDQIKDYAINALKWAAENKIVNGYADGRLAPNDNASRAHVSQMLKNCFDK